MVPAQGFSEQRQLRKGLKKIEGYLPEFEGVATRKLQAEIKRRLKTIERGGRVRSYPEIETARPWSPVAPRRRSTGPRP